MANLDYCRFNNTLEDLRDCYDHMEDQLSSEEQEARNRLIELCADIADEYVDLVE